MLIPHEEGFRAWRLRPGGQPEEARSWRKATWVALPARSLITVPFRFQGVDESRREAMAQLELEAAGFGQETADATDFDVWNLGQDERDQRSISFVQVSPLPADVLEEAEDARFVPSVAFRTLTPGEALIWREAGAFVMAIPHDNGQPLYCQALAARVLDADAAAEIRCVLASLEINGLSPNVQSLAIIKPSAGAAAATAETGAVTPENGGAEAQASQEALPQSEPIVITAEFREGLDFPVGLRAELPPVAPAHESRLIPEPVVRQRHERQQRRMVLMGAMAFAFVIVAALGAFAARVALREHSLKSEVARLDALEPDLMTIRDAQAAWDDMKFAITPDMYPVETLHQLIQILPPEGIRLTRFEVREDGIVLDGVASNLGLGINFREKVMSNEFFKRWLWDYPPPTSMNDGQATFHAEGRISDGTEENTEVTSL